MLFHIAVPNHQCEKGDEGGNHHPCHEFEAEACWLVLLRNEVWHFHERKCGECVALGLCGFALLWGFLCGCCGGALWCGCDCGAHFGKWQWRTAEWAEIQSTRWQTLATGGAECHLAVGIGGSGRFRSRFSHGWRLLRQFAHIYRKFAHALWANHHTTAGSEFCHRQCLLFSAMWASKFHTSERSSFVIQMQRYKNYFM